MAYGDVTDMVHVGAEGRAVGALAAGTKHLGDVACSVVKICGYNSIAEELMGKAENVANPRSEVRRSAILTVAWKAFLEHGFAGASMSDIAERLGGSKGTLYNYFPSKQDLFLAAIGQKGDELRSNLISLSRDTGNLEEDLTHLATRLLELVATDDYLAFYRVMIAEAARFPFIGDAAYRDRRSTILAPLTGRIDKEIKAGRLQQVDAMEAADVFWDLCSSSFHWRSMLGLSAELTSQEIRRLVERGVWIFLSAYGVAAEDKASRPS